MIVAFDLHRGARVALVASRIGHLFEQLIDTRTIDCTRLNECIHIMLVGKGLTLALHYFYLFDMLFGADTFLNRVLLPGRTYAAEELAGALKDALNAATWFGDNQYGIR